jgi:hypothetical protein
MGFDAHPVRDKKEEAAPAVGEAWLDCIAPKGVRQADPNELCYN